VQLRAGGLPLHGVRVDWFGRIFQVTCGYSAGLHENTLDIGNLLLLCSLGFKYESSGWAGSFANAVFPERFEEIRGGGEPLDGFVGAGLQKAMRLNAEE
jgi:hypothetical protein